MLKTALLVFLVYTLAIFVQRISGFGSGIVAIMILPYLIGSHGQTTAYTNIFSAISATSLAIRFRKDCKWRLFAPILCGSFLATFFAVRFQARASFDLLEKLLGAVLLILSIYFLFLKGKLAISPKPRNGFLAGLCGGTLNGLFSAGGPPVVLYLLGATANHAEYFATLQGYFAFNNIYAITVRILNGQVTPAILPGVVGGLFGLMLGNFLGGKAVKYIPEDMFLKIIYLMMAVSGISMLL